MKEAGLARSHASRYYLNSPPALLSKTALCIVASVF